jgi:hypothetical protein
LDVGSGKSAYELPLENQQAEPSTKGSSPNGQAEELGRISTFGIGRRPWPCWKNESSYSFTIRQSGNIGQVILDSEGNVICWTVDPWLAQVIARMLENANTNGLLR